MKQKQTERVLAYIREFGSITHREAEEHLGVMRLSARVNDLKNQGHVIVGKMVPVKNRDGATCYIKRYYEGVAPG